MRWTLAGFTLVLVAAGPGNAIAGGEQDQFDRSWESHHWAVMMVLMEKPRRLAAVVDRESLQSGPDGTREFNFLTLSEGEARRIGLVGRVRIDCRTMAMTDLGSVRYSGGDGVSARAPDTDPVMLQPEAAIYPAAQAACSGDFGAMQLIDGDEAAMRRATFPS